MRRSPRRPLILKRRKLPFVKSETEVPHDEPDVPQRKVAPTAHDDQCLPDAIRIVDHPSMPDTQVVVIPKTADLQTIIDTLSAKGKECGPQGPNKFILLSGGSGSLEDWPSSLSLPALGEDSNIRAFGNPLTFNEAAEGGARTDCSVETMPLTTATPLDKELDCSLLDESLTNIQWLGGMCSDGLGTDADRKTANKENQETCAQRLQPSQNLDGAQRPPYSYMAMIQFAINSKPDRRMTLKEIYTWIEDHFPYFRNVAKPGWKNSIRHNLSLHDMFIRETSQDGKISFWTIRPEANRCLTLDQVYKSEADPAASHSSQAAQVCETQVRLLFIPPHCSPLLHLHQSAHAGRSGEQKEELMQQCEFQTEQGVITLLELTSEAGCSINEENDGSNQFSDRRGGWASVTDRSKGTVDQPVERKMKPLLPRTDSYLVPVQLSLSPSLFLPLAASQQNCSSSAADFPGGAKRVRIAPKCAPPPVEELKEEPLCVSLSYETPVAAPHNPKRETSGSRRKQCLAPPSREEPVLLFPDSTFFDSGLTSDLSVSQDMRDAELDSPGRAYAFKTPIKSGRPASSTPSKPPTGDTPITVSEPWRRTPSGGENQDVLDFSPIRTPLGAALTPQHQHHTPFSLNITPFQEPPLFSSPRELLTSPGMERQRPCSRELQVGGPPTANRSITEGLVLDTMNDSLSKILVDISFSGLEDEELDVCNISWSQLIPELK
ncbi:hypothetical protein JZ751_016127 [Albula glossodonta]|uniref:Forkhead box protein M1 n=1 Tax=Albula glossodonta TaxID=121402 RepID=A0A8T2NTZ9_9TELE|nr:hypothetical protein JZ751_016127 [Albula glossodonta]